MHTLVFYVNNKPINEDSLRQVEEQVGTSKSTVLHLVVNTNGGSPFSAVRIMRLLQERYQKIRVIIPDHAMSAGTLMSLGGDEIYMSYKSMLGPLDLPIEHPIDRSRISALDINNTVPNLAALSKQIADNYFSHLQHDCNLSKSEAATIAYNTATKLVQPIVDKIDPYHLQNSYRSLRIGMYYAIDLLATRMMADDEFQAFETAQKLVNNYPAHEYGIFLGEAKNALRLNAFEISDLKEWNTIKKLPPLLDNNDKIVMIGK